jgi:hypothetical protein
MRNKTIACMALGLGGVVFVSLFVYLSGPSRLETPSENKKLQKATDFAFTDEPAARALYEKMIQTMRNAESLSFTSDYQYANWNPCTYKIWMKKPNYFRVEIIDIRGDRTGILIGDGNDLWIYWPWPNERYSKYMKEATPLGRHSIGHKTGQLGGGMSMPIIDPSTFHGYTDSLQSYIDGIRMIGMEKVGNEACDMIEVSIMKGQRIWQLWLSKQDHLPRKLKEVVRVSTDIIISERWTEVAVNNEIPLEKFAWTPPEGWEQVQPPNPEDNLLKSGQTAPDFELASADEGTIKLLDYRGKVVWFYIWKAG